MNFFLKMDIYSKALCVIGLVGIVVGIYFLTNISISDQAGTVKIAEISHYQSDVRLKRNESIHWFPVAKKLDCFEGDVLFSGDESFATISFSDGDVVILHPNSLVTVSRNQVELESGVIDVKLNEKSALNVVAFGEKIEGVKKTKLRVSNKDGKSKITALGENTKKLSGLKGLQKYVVEENITIQKPYLNQIFANSNEVLIPLAWYTSLDKVEFEIEVSDSSSFAMPYKKIRSKTTSLNIPATEFREGLNWWRVIYKDVKSDVSSFNITKKITPELTFPENAQVFQLHEQTKIPLQWNLHAELKQKLQISKMESFKSILYESNVDEGTYIYLPKEVGRFFWRIGVEISKDRFLWSETRNFEIELKESEIVIDLFMQSKLDFSLEKKFPVKISSSKNCNLFLMEILNSLGAIVRQSKLRTKEFEIEELKDGEYVLKASCLEDKMKKAVKELKFKVKTSLPLPAPKIKTKKNKLFVFFENVLNVIFPSALGSDDINQIRGETLLEWEQSDAQEFEIEIAFNNSNNIIEREITRESSYLLKVKEIGKYFWRVRSKIENRWSQFSKWTLIEAEDSIKLLKKSLMIRPAQGDVIESSKGEVNILFEWERPLSGLSYTIEIISGGKVIYSKEDLAGSKLKVHLKLKTDSTVEYSWRVIAVSRYGIKSVTQNYNNFKIRPLPNQDVKLFSVENIYSKVSLSSFNASLKDKSLSRQVDVSGLGSSLITGFLSEWKIFSFDYMTSELSAFLSAGSGHRRLESNIKLYKKLGNTNEMNQNIYAGLSVLGSEINHVDLESGRSLSALMIVGYGFKKPLSNANSMKANIELHQQLTADMSSPGGEATLSYEFKRNKNWFYDFFVNYRLLNQKMDNNLESRIGYFGLGLAFNRTLN